MTRSITAPAVCAMIPYTSDAGAPTALYYYECEAAAAARAPGDDPREMRIYDGWDDAASFSLDEQGFAVRELVTAFDAWEDDDAVRAAYYPEVVDLLKRSVGASRVLVFDHTIRAQGNIGKKLTQETKTSQRAPVALVHCDYTHESGPLRVRQLLPGEAERLLSRRVAFYNVWKPIRRVVEERPLALCDVASSPPRDFAKLYLHYRDRIGENYVLRHNPSHRWWYFPKMTPDAVVLLKTYESETDGRARFVGHTAFEDPTSPPDAPARESIEIRAMAFF